MFWNRVSPFDVWWTPGVSNIADAAVIERTRVTRADLNQLIGLPGYNEAAIREVLKWYGRSGYVEVNASTAETPRALAESREDPRMNQSGMIDMLEYHGYVQGEMLLEHGFTTAEIEDPMRDYFVDAFKIGRYIIKVQLSPSPEKAAALLCHLVRESPRHRRRQCLAGYPHRHPGRHKRCAPFPHQQHVHRQSDRRSSSTTTASPRTRTSTISTRGSAGIR